MSTKTYNLLAATAAGLTTSFIVYLILRENFEYKLLYKLGTLDEPPTTEEVHGLAKQLQDVYDDPSKPLITSQRINVEKYRIFRD